MTTVTGSTDGLTYDYSGTTLTISGTGQIEDLNRGSINHTTGLLSVTDVVICNIVSNNITSICDDAFSGCTSLRYIAYSNGLTTIGESTFKGCTSLKTVSMGNSTASIGSDAFSGCTSLTSITIPSSVTYMGDGVFDNMSSITVTMLSTIPCTIESNTFDADTFTIYVPYNTKSTYVAASSYWANLTNHIVESDPITIGGTYIKTASSTWSEATDVWIKTADGWVRTYNKSLKTGDGWKYI